MVSRKCFSFRSSRTTRGISSDNEGCLVIIDSGRLNTTVFHPLDNKDSASSVVREVPSLVNRQTSFSARENS